MGTRQSVTPDLDALLTDAFPHSDWCNTRHLPPGSCTCGAAESRQCAGIVFRPVLVRLHEAEQARDDWRLITDGAKHDPRCPFNETDVGPRQAWPCLRCQMQAAEAREAALREALIKQADLIIANSPDRPGENAASRDRELHRRMLATSFRDLATPPTRSQP